MSSKKSKKRKKTQSSPKKSISKVASFWTIRNLLPIALILITTLICFYPSVKCEFVNWDDDKNFYENKHITTLNKENFWANTKEIFSNHVIGNYNPLTIWAFAIEYKVSGYHKPITDLATHAHWINIILHLFCVFLVYRICLIMGLRPIGSIVVALLFAIHPMRVESVTWITERKDVLYGAFFLAAVFFFVKYLYTTPKRRYIYLIFLFFVLSLLSKIQAVTLPLTFLAIEYHHNGWERIKSIFKKRNKGRKSTLVFYTLLFAISLIFGIIGILFLGDQGSLEATATYPLWQRIFIGAFSFLIFLIKSIVPYKMSPLYPYPQNIPWFIYMSIVIAPILVYGLWRMYKSKKRVLLFGLMFFIVNIIFLLQVLGAGQGFLADRFTYIAYLGLFFIVGYYADYCYSSFKKYKVLIAGATLCLLGFYGYLTHNQTKIWTNSETLWTHVLKYNTNITLPYGNRANYRRDIGDLKGALEDYNATIKLKSTDPGPFNSRGRLHFNKQDRQSWQMALQDYNKAIELAPSEAEYYANRGATYAKLGQLDNALNDLSQCLKLNPNHAVGYLNRSVIFNQQGKIREALGDIRSYLKINPYNGDLWYEAGRCNRRLNNDQAAIDDYTKAIAYNPKPLFYYERSKAYLMVSRAAEAKNDLDKAISLNAGLHPNQRTPIDPGYIARFNK